MIILVSSKDTDFISIFCGVLSRDFGSCFWYFSSDDRGASLFKDVSPNIIFYQCTTLSLDYGAGTSDSLGRRLARII